MLRGVYLRGTAEILLPRLRDQNDSERLSMTAFTHDLDGGDLAEVPHLAEAAKLLVVI